MTAPEVFKSRESATRRNFIGGTAAALAAGLCGTLLETKSAVAQAEGPNLLGPRAGYSPQVGSFVSMLTWMRESNGVLSATKGLSQADLDALFDANANTIGALMLHLVATETYYQMNTFDGMKWDSWGDDVKKKWDPAMNLGGLGRKEIKGHDLDFYLNALHESRERNLAEFKKRDDKWLLGFDTEQFGKEKVNVYWKWFHVCEHESHHAGQIGFLAKRIPGAKPSSD